MPTPQLLNIPQSALPISQPAPADTGLPAGATDLTDPNAVRDSGINYGQIVKDIAKSSALPMTLGGIGGAAGLLTGPAAPIASPLLGGIGSATGEIINQGLGITEQNPWTIALAGLPMPGAAAARNTTLGLNAAKAGLESLVTKNLGPRGQTLLRSVEPTVESGQLFQRLMATGAPVKVGTAATRQAVFDAQRELSRIPADLQPAMKGIIEGLDTLAYSGTHVPFENMRVTQQAVGAKLRGMAIQGGEGAGLAKQLYKAMWKDVEDAVATQPGPMGTLLRDAVSAKKAEEAVEILKEAFTPAFRGGEPIVRVDSVMGRIAKNREILEPLMPGGAAAYDDLMSTLKAQAKLLDKPGKGVGAVAERHPYLAGGMVGLGAEAGGLGTLSALKAGAASAATIAAYSQFLVSPSGRALVRQMAGNGVRFDIVANAMGQGILAGGTQLMNSGHGGANLQGPQGMSDLPPGAVQLGAPTQ